VCAGWRDERNPMPKFRALDNLDVRGKRALLRADPTLSLPECRSTEGTAT